MKTYVGQISSIADMFASVSERYEAQIRAVGKIKDRLGRLTSVIDIVESVLGELPFAKYPKDKGYEVQRGIPMRMFNGQYYEMVWSEDVMHEMFRWLSRYGCDTGVLVAYRRRIADEACYYICRSVLQPRKSLMCFKNGVVDFTAKKLELLPFGKEHDVVKQYGFRFDMSAIDRCPLWSSFVGEPDAYYNNVCGVLPEKWKRRMLQMFLGSLLIERSSVAFEHFLILHGPGGNGKSVISRMLTDLFGDDEVSELQISQLGRQGDERLRAAASLDGKRLVYCPEEASGQLKDMSFLKSLASGENISSRRIGEDIGHIQNPPVVMMNANKDWKAEDFIKKDRVGDLSLLRRVVIIPFDKVIPKDKRDTTLWMKFRDEYDGIFAWIVKGFLELRKNKWRMPDDKGTHKRMTLETAKCPVYINGSMVDGTILFYFQNKHVEPTNLDWYNITIPTRRIYANYKKFCEENELPVATIQKFGRDLASMGYTKRNMGENGDSAYELWWKECKDVDVYMRSVPSLKLSTGDLYIGEELSMDEFREEFMK